jgi:DNA modification methylase
MSRPIKNHNFDTVYDPFLGSGTTMIACENLGRKCRGCEISPEYVAVILERFKTTFNKQPVLLEGD